MAQNFQPKRLFQGALSTTLTTVLATVPGTPDTASAKQWIVTDIEIVNTSPGFNASVTLTMPGHASGSELFSSFQVLSGSRFQWTGRMVVECGETICGGVAGSSATATVVICGVEAAAS